jgi:hypothetical protein
MAVQANPSNPNYPAARIHSKQNDRAISKFVQTLVGMEDEIRNNEIPPFPNLEGAGGRPEFARPILGAGQARAAKVLV